MPECVKPDIELTKQVKGRLYERYRFIRDHDWESLEHFMQWALETGVWKGAFLRRKDESKPHGPDNSYWSDQPSISNRNWGRQEIARSPFCEGCERNTEYGCGGCEKWEEYFVKNWNQNIHVKINIPEIVKPADEGHEKFRYEHPDLIREGIV